MTKILNIIIIVLIIAFIALIIFEPTRDTSYSDYSSQKDSLEKEIQRRNLVIMDIVLKSDSITNELKIKDSVIFKLKTKFNESKKVYNDIDDDSAYIFIKRYLSEEYEPLF